MLPGKSPRPSIAQLLERERKHQAEIDEREAEAIKAMLASAETIGTKAKQALEDNRTARYGYDGSGEKVYIGKDAEFAAAAVLVDDMVAEILKFARKEPFDFSLLEAKEVELFRVRKNIGLPSYDSSTTDHGVKWELGKLANFRRNISDFIKRRESHEGSKAR